MARDLMNHDFCVLNLPVDETLQIKWVMASWRHLSRSSLIILNREPPGCVETRPAAIERIKRTEPKLKEYKEVLEAAERKLRNNDSGATTIADLLLSDAASVFQGLVRYQGRQLFVNNQWVEAYLKLIRGHFEPNASTSP